MLLMVTNNSLNRLSIESLSGQWIGKHKNYEIILTIKKNNKCSLEFRFIASNEVENLNGDCVIDTSKKPYSFIMSNIKELNTALYSLVSLRNNNNIYMSEFSTKWKLRPVKLRDDNTIIFIRNILQMEEK
jgi:hypothetical protein